MNWIKENWDKIIGVFLSLILGGVVGFFSATSKLGDDISELKTQIAISKNTLEEITRKVSELSAVNNRIQGIEIRLVSIEAQSIVIKSQTDIMLRTQIERLPPNAGTPQRR
ncbi:hypothetical protein J4G43_021610 [Bradyrhizobium barranii subsp. barranii]|uniref:Uncharacterized protein n=1 Tax=Bradyrhizobium barranii subsp. barranii TaxID=2823807 RepID=A0A939S4W4_9BRAD|nr:hypothetical protein [Bradyrhizobium barranii]UEM16579.1 hypothetical protein J4G43_021610 [Bradyrhizobium barranii subsp. barranii]